MNISSFAACCSLSAVLLMNGIAFAQERAPCHEAAAHNEAVVRQAFERWAAGGSVFEILSPDVIWTIRGSGPYADTYVGADSFLKRAAAPLVDRLAGPIQPVVHFVWILRMEDGLVQSAEAFLDLAAYQEVIDNNEPAP